MHDTVGVLSKPGAPSVALVARLGLLVFVASCATLVLELVAGRLLSPFIGVSLYTWTSIIGVVLAGVSVGSWLGGWVADRFASFRLVAALLLVGAATSGAALGWLALLGDGTILRPLPFLARVFLLTMVAFLPCSLVLGMVTPAAIKLALPDVRRTGRVAGLVYALATLGSLAGNFLTGFVLVAHLTVTAIVALVAVALVVAAALSWRWSRSLASVGDRPPPPGEAEPAHAPTSPAPPPAHGEHRLDLRGNAPLACAVAAAASFCSMAIELAASRVLAPYVGVSLYSWTGIIGTVLAGIAIGNVLGGRIADRWPRQLVVGASLLLGGLATLGVLAAVQVAPSHPLITRLGLMERIVALTAALFLLPVLVLGTVSPQITRLAITDLREAGRVAGRIYAWSTAGAIGGTFATGWVLISLLGVHALLFTCGLALVALAVVVGRFWRHAAVLAVATLVTAGTLVGLVARDALRSPCTLETNYFCIKVYDDTRGGTPVKALVLDHLVHSFVKIGDPSYLGYEHEQIQADFTRLVAAETPTPRVLLIGGGGYTYPRWVEAFVPSATVEVVEIDPGVTEIAHRELGLPRDTRIITHNMDGRQFVQELAPRGHYHLVVQDAVNDLSVPYHIMTKEYNDLIQQILTPDGIYLLTVIDLYADGQLLRAALCTMMQTFPEVELLAPYPAWQGSGASVYVIYGSRRPLDLDAVQRALRAQGATSVGMVALPDDQLRAYVDDGPPVVLTDQYAPVDNLIVPLFARRG